MPYPNVLAQGRALALAALLTTGANVLAVELHQQSRQDDDAGFDLELVAY